MIYLYQTIRKDNRTKYEKRAEQAGYYEEMVSLIQGLLAQTERMDDEDRLRQDGMEKVIRYGIAYCKKKCGAAVKAGVEGEGRKCGRNA